MYEQNLIQNYSNTTCQLLINHISDLQFVYKLILFVKANYSTQSKQWENMNMVNNTEQPKAKSDVRKLVPWYSIFYEHS